MRACASGHFTGAAPQLANEPKALAANETVNAQSVASAFARAGAKIDQPIGPVSYLDRCPIPGGTGEHLVLQTDFGKVHGALLFTNKSCRICADKSVNNAHSICIARYVPLRVVGLPSARSYAYKC